ncbi:hypothetical protein RI129_003271 [Pyrocoelia pectoralis]|uniref:DUF4371 domain-containing protein n=1 Tax=Pyrocoelia pectoralis TaxID=417401 RepID=A0AAN7VRF1_9COLE
MSKQVKLFEFLKRKKEDESTSTTVTVSNSDEQCSKEQKCRKPPNRKYNEECIKQGFTFIDNGGIQLPQCVVCAEVLSNDAMKPAKLVRHLQSKHKHFMGKPLEFFKRKELELKSNKKIIKTFSTQEKASLKASYIVSLRIAQAKKPFTIGEDLVLPCIIDATREILGESYAQKMKNIPLSNNTVSRRIDAMALDAECQLIAKVHSSKYFALQLDESTDVTNKAILLVYVKYIDEVINNISEEYMTCIELLGYTTGGDIFNAIDGYLKLHNLSWQCCVGLCTDGAAAMTGYKTGRIRTLRRERYGAAVTAQPFRPLATSAPIRFGAKYLERN